MDWMLSSILCVAMVCAAFLGRRVQGSWWAPAPIVSVTWAIAAGLPLVVGGDLPIYPATYVAALTFVVLSLVGSTLGASIAPELPYLFREGLPPVPQVGDWRIYYVLVGLGCFGPILLFENAQALTSASNLTELAMQTSKARYEGEFVPPLAVRMLSSVTYAAGAVGAFLTAVTPPSSRRWLRSALWLFPIVGMTLVYTAKANVLFGLVHWACGWAVGKAYRGPIDGARQRSRVLLYAVAAAVAVPAFLVLVQSMRMDRVSAADIPYVLEHLRIYVVGHMPVFGHWLTNDATRAQDLSLGASTFAGLADTLGIGERQQGLYDGTASFTESNIYTAIRPLLEDFGIAGACVFVLSASFVAGVGWRILRAGRLWGALPLAAFVAYVLFSPIASIFAYANLILSLLIFGAWSYFTARRLDNRTPNLAVAATNLLP